MKNKEVATVTVVDYADKSFLGLMMPNGEYRVSMVEVLTIFFKCIKRSFVELKELTGLDLEGRQVATVLTEQTINRKKVVTLTLNELHLVATRLAAKGNEDAKMFIDMSEAKSVEKAFEDAFNWKFKHLSRA